MTYLGVGAFQGCRGLTNITIGKGIRSIENYTFSDCRGLTSITLPDRLDYIGEGAFSCCYNLTSINIPDGVVGIGMGAFSGCPLTSITIPNKVSWIESYAFDCSTLTSIYCKATTPPEGSKDMFPNNASDLKIYVPTESVDAYKAADYWVKYANHIIGYDFE